jgi:FKBP-type peptidyl-prolyl cis-trans isomerase
MKLSSTIIALILLVGSTFALQSCDQNTGFYQTFFPKAAPPPFDSTTAVSDSALSEGTKIYIVKEGTGHFHVVYQDQLIVRLTGRTARGKIFRTSYTKLKSSSNTTTLPNLTPIPITISTQLGARTVPPLVDGLRNGLLGMKEGEKRIIRVPPSQGYTSSNSFMHHVNLYHKTLVYDVELVRINR